MQDWVAQKLCFLFQSIKWLFVVLGIYNFAWRLNWTMSCCNFHVFPTLRYCWMPKHFEPWNKFMNIIPNILFFIKKVREVVNNYKSNKKIADRIILLQLANSVVWYTLHSPWWIPRRNPNLFHYFVKNKHCLYVFEFYLIQNQNKPKNSFFGDKSGLNCGEE